MPKPFPAICRVLAIALVATLPGLRPAGAQDFYDQPPALLPGLGLEHGALLFHGNYCGPGNRAPAPPIDALDAACMRHDACYPDLTSGRLASCACNARLLYEATRIARDPRQPDEERAAATLVADGAQLLPCEPGRVVDRSGY